MKTIERKSNAGRKPLADKMIPVQCYVRESVVDKAGGVDAARIIAKVAVEKAGKK